MPAPTLPIIDVSALITNTDNKQEVADQIGQACRETGFFYIVNHGVDESLEQRVDEIAQRFYKLPVAEKEKLKLSDKYALKGYVATKGDGFTEKLKLPYNKEGLRFGNKIEEANPIIKEKLPSFFADNLYPESIPEMKPLVEDYMNQLGNLSQKILGGIALSLGLSETFFYDNYTNKPTMSFRLFNYPKVDEEQEEAMGIGAHSDFGLMTLVKQDQTGGLEARVTTNEWVDVTPVAGSYVVNIGDMMDFITGGLYRSTPHRVRSSTKKDRRSMVIFFDPNIYVPIKRIEGIEVVPYDQIRWDKQDLYKFKGTFANFAMDKYITDA